MNFHRFTVIRALEGKGFDLEFVDSKEAVECYKKSVKSKVYGGVRLIGWYYYQYQGKTRQLETCADIASWNKAMVELAAKFGL